MDGCNGSNTSQKFLPISPVLMAAVERHVGLVGQPPVWPITHQQLNLSVSFELQ